MVLVGHEEKFTIHESRQPRLPRGHYSQLSGQWRGRGERRGTRLSFDDFGAANNPMGLADSTRWVATYLGTYDVPRPVL